MKKAEYKHGSKFERVRKISRTGIYSYYVTIPKDYIAELDWKEQDEVKVTLDRNGITIKKI